MNKFYNSISNFLKKLFSDEGSVSSKRVVGIGAFCLITAAVIVNLCGGATIAQFIFWGLVSLIGACFGLNTLINMKSIDSKSNVASDVTNSGASSSTIEQVKDIVEQIKP